MVDASAKDDVVAAVINFNTAGLTRRCTQSLVDAGIARILVLDNGSAMEDYLRLRSEHAVTDERVRIIRSEKNLGFAQGSNELIEEALREPRCQRILLLNSDATVDAKGLETCLRTMRDSGHDLMGGRMLKPATAGE